MAEQAAFRGLVISDVDSTFLTHEVIELIADHAGVRDEVERVTTAAMRGELDFAQSLNQRVALLEGLDESVLDSVRASLELRDGARELVEAALARGWRFALVSGGFTEIIAPLAASLGIHDVVANSFDIADGKLTGKVRGEIVTGEVKARTARDLQAKWGIPAARTIAMGDGANDILMMAEAGHTVGINPKPALREVVKVAYGDSLRPVIADLERLDGLGD